MTTREQAFDPRSPEYHNIHDLPERYQGIYIGVEGGFVRREAIELELAEKFQEMLRDNPHVFEQRLSELKAEEAVACDQRRDEIFAAVKKDPKMLQLAGEQIGDRALTLEAVRRDGNSLEYAVFKNDREVVLEAVRQNGGALEWASRELKADREIVLEAVKNSPFAIAYVASELRNDREIVLIAAKQQGWLALSAASPSLRNDREIVLEAVNSDPRALFFASPELQADRDVVLTAVKMHGQALSSASLDLRSDREVVLEALKQNQRALIFTPLCWDLDFLKEAVLQTSPEVLQYAPRSIRIKLGVERP